MVNATLIIEAIRARLDADTTLREVLGTKPDSSKVLAQAVLPLDAAMLPLVLVSDFAMTALRSGQRSKQYQAAIDITIYCAPKANGAPDIDLIYSAVIAIDESIRFTDAGFKFVSGTTMANSFELQQSAAIEALEPQLVRKVLTYQCMVSGA